MKLLFDTTKLSITDLIKLRRLEYNRFPPVACPLLNGELVHFNKDGFFHATHNGQGKIRNNNDQRMRLNLLPKITQVIAKASCFGSPIRVIAANDPANNLHKSVTYYELIHSFSPQETYLGSFTTYRQRSTPLLQRPLLQEK